MATLLKFRSQPGVFYLAAFLAALFFIPQAFATPQITESTEYYDIQGRTTADLGREMNEKGIREGSQTHAGRTRWNIKWRYHYQDAGADCRLESVEVTLDIHYEMPRWVHHEAVPAEVIQKWESYYAALEAHEKGHADHGREAAQEIENAIYSTGSGTPCSEFNAKADAAGNAILDRYRQIEIDYDAETKHGRTQGAWLS